MKSYILILALFLPLSSAQADISKDDIGLSHPQDTFGTVLIGAAHIYENSIGWIGDSSASTFFVDTMGYNSGFTGDILYMLEDSSGGGWLYEDNQRVVTSQFQGDGSEPKISFYYAPGQEGQNKVYNNYQAQADGQASVFVNLEINGQGVVDDIDQPAIRLDVRARKGQQVYSEEDIVVIPGEEIIFEITPRVDAVAFQQLQVENPGLEDVEHVLIELLIAQDIGQTPVECERYNLFFKEEAQARDIEDINGYYDYLDALGLTQMRENCWRSTSFVASVDKTFLFKTTNLRTIPANGSVNYRFQVRGHTQKIQGETGYEYDRSKWPDSHHLFRFQSTDNHEQSPCYQVGDDLRFNDVVGKYQGRFYQLDLAFWANPADPSGLYWQEENLKVGDVSQTSSWHCPGYGNGFFGTMVR